MLIQPIFFGKNENINLIISNPKFVKANWFILKFEKGLSEISMRFPYELRSFFSGMLFIKIAQLINKNRSSGKSIDMLINFPSLENYYHSEIDDEIAREIKEEIYHKNLKGHNESNCLSNIKQQNETQIFYEVKYYECFISIFCVT